MRIYEKGYSAGINFPVWGCCIQIHHCCSSVSQSVIRVDLLPIAGLLVYMQDNGLGRPHNSLTLHQQHVAADEFAGTGDGSPGRGRRRQTGFEQYFRRLGPQLNRNRFLWSGRTRQRPNVRLFGQY